MFKKIKMRFLPLLAAVVLLIAIPIRVDAASGTSSGNFSGSGSYRLEFNDGEFALYCVSAVFGGRKTMLKPFYFVFLNDGFYVLTYEHRFMELKHVSNSAECLEVYGTCEDDVVMCGRTWDRSIFIPWGTSIYGNVLNSEQDILDLCTYSDGVYKLYDTETSYTEAVDFFYLPPTLPGGMQIVERVEEIPELVTEHLTILIPTAVFCLALVALSPALLIRLKRFL